MKGNRKPVVRKRETFEEFLKSNQLSKSDRHNWEDRKDLYKKSVDELYDQISKWLKPFVDKSLLKVHDREIEMFEDHLGSYRTRRRDIYLGKKMISLRPQGTLIYGSVGRVDMDGPKGHIMLVEPEWDKWEIHIRLTNTITWPLNGTTFKNIFQEVVNGSRDRLF